MPPSAAETTQEATEALAARRPSFLLLITLAAVGPFAMNIVVPAQPAMAEMLGTPYGIIQLILTAYLAAIAVTQLILGPLSDRFGRRPVVIVGLGLFAIGSLICALAPNVETLIAGRIVQAAGGCAGVAVGRAIIRDMFDREQAASSLGYVSMGMVVAPMLAPFFGGLLFDAFGWRAMFWLLMAVGVIVFFASRRHLHETRQPKSSGEREAYWIEVLDLLRNRDFCAYVTVLAFASGIFFSFLNGAAYIMRETLDRPASEYGTYFAVSALGYMLGNFFTGRYAAKVGPDRMITIGMLTCFCGLALLWSLSGILHPLALFAPMTILAISNGLILPSATANAVSVRPNLAGTASGLSGAVQLGIGALLAFIVGMLQEQSGTTLPMIVIMTISAAFSLLGFLMIRRR